MKNSLIKKLKISLFNHIKKKIIDNYSGYISFLLNTAKKIEISTDKSQSIEVLFNSKDYSYFLENSERFQEQFRNTIEIDKAQEDFIGGFKISLGNGLLSYDYTIDNLINKNSSFIQKEMSKIVDDSEVKELENDFNNFIQNQKSKINEYLKKYDQIQI
ncbi:MAG: hypothetical protein ACFE9C_01200 [Candidatus Hodarchaeota archaeon]